jgi:formylglycine-generating enzyme required for sulfatase activity
MTIELTGLALVFTLAAPGEESAPPPPKDGATSLRLRVLPRRVHVRGEQLLRAELEPRREASFRWQASAGKLLGQDAAEVLWEAPATPCRVAIEVEACLAGRPTAEAIRVRVEVPVEPASTAGMVRVPGGLFTMGDTWTDVNDPGFIQTNQNMADKPAHLVEISPYWIDRDRVTNEEFACFLNNAHEEGLLEVTEIAVMGLHRGSLVVLYRFSFADHPELARQPKLRRAIRWDGRVFRVNAGQERHPLVDVTWAGADAYARCHGKRLPTEAQWELAARGTDGRKYPWGNEVPGPRHANVNHVYGDRLFPVGTFSPEGDSPYGVRELVGGVFEWVQDWFQEDHYRDRWSPKPLKDPMGPHWGKDHALRGVPATNGVTGDPFEQQPVSFRYAWIFEAPIGDGFANAETGFRTALPEAFLAPGGGAAAGGAAPGLGSEPR